MENLKMNEYKKAVELIELIKEKKISQYKVSKETGVFAPTLKRYREGKADLMNATYKNIKSMSDLYDQLESDWHDNK